MQQDMMSFMREINQTVRPTVKAPADIQEPPPRPSIDAKMHNPAQHRGYGRVGISIANHRLCLGQEYQLPEGTINPR